MVWVHTQKTETVGPELRHIRVKHFTLWNSIQARNRNRKTTVVGRSLLLSNPFVPVPV